jgi:hypothetical protein
VLKSGQWFFFFSWCICICYTFPPTHPFKINHTTIHSFTHSSPSPITFLKYPFPISLFCKLFQSRSGIQNNVKSHNNGGKQHPVCWVQWTWVTNCSMPQNHCTPEVTRKLFPCSPVIIMLLVITTLLTKHDSLISLLMFWNLHKHR